MKDEKIIIRLRGGLGNQLFQYAFGRSLSLASGLPLELDINEYANSAERSYKLGFYDFNVSLASKREVSKYYLFNYYPIDKIINSVLFSGKVYYERSFEFDPSFNFQPITGKYIVGYWHSYKYFEEFNNVITGDILASYQKYPTSLNCLVDEIKSCTSVSIHVRRGDYLLGGNNNYYHVCGLDYYKKSIMHLRGKYDNLRFFVFSDDIEWAKCNFNSIRGITYVILGPNIDTTIWDLFLMSLCNHHIIANSSYSWWGAWLNPEVAKTVIAPRQWFRPLHLNTLDLVPPSWTSL